MDYNMIRQATIILLLLTSLLPVVATASAGDGQLGRYVRVTKSPQFIDGGRESGELLVKSVKNGRASFRLEVTWNPVADDDGYYTHNGLIEEGEVRITGRRGRYASSYEEGKDLGQCIIDFTFKEKEVILLQSEKCWWFGENVDASGVYRLTNAEDIQYVK